jgi:Bacterial protein of unknown function (DUF839)/Domain of unknown function (DUF4114)
MATITGPSSSQTPYLVPVAPGVDIKSIITVGDAAPNGYKLVGIPDGLGAFDNGDGTFTVLMNHEIGSSAAVAATATTPAIPAAPLGVARAHGSAGAFVSKWTIKKSDLSVVKGEDLITNVFTWNPTTSAFVNGTTVFNRFCAADLPNATAFYNSATGLGTTARIFLNGEESGVEGRAFGHIATGASAGTSYELPYLGKFAWETAVANPYTSNKTVVAGLDDGQNGQVYIYVGTKTNTGTDIDKAGLNNGKLFGVKVAGLVDELAASTPAIGTRFTLSDLTSVAKGTGAALDAASETAGVTSFLRPEDGAWDPSNRRDFYFNTTHQYDQVSNGAGTQVGNSRVWRLRFDDANNPEAGGTIEAVVDGTTDKDATGKAVKVNMLDNMAIDNYGHIILQEDVGNQAHSGKIWQYDIATDSLTQLLKFDSARFGDIGVAATAPFTIDEESSGAIDMQSILGAGWFLADAQAHYPTTDKSLVEGGQLFAFYNPTTANSAAAASKNLDMREIATKIKFDTTVTSDAAYGNYGGFYEIDDATGRIGNLNPGDVGYAKAAIERAITKNFKTESTSTQIDGGKLLAPYLIANGTAADFLSKNSTNAGGANEIHAYFNYLGANPDKIQHMKATATGFACEDVFGGGDLDFNDYVIGSTFKAA